MLPKIDKLKNTYQCLETGNNVIYTIIAFFIFLNFFIFQYFFCRQGKKKQSGKSI